MTAKEMFEALGYKLYEDDIAIVFENNQGDVIAFTYKDKELVVQPTNISKSISMAELKSINMQIKELGWIKPEVKPDETNFEHFFEYLSKRRMSDFALIDGRVTQCMDTRCSKCDFNGDCIEKKFKWLKQPYKKPIYKLSQFEYDLILTYRDCHESCKLSEFKQLIELKDKGYFKCVDYDTKIHDVLEACEANEDEDNC